MADRARERAEQSVAVHFTRIMNASTSPYGPLIDPPIIAAATSVFVIALLAMMRLEVGVLAVQVLAIVAALPIAIAVLMSLALRGARARVVAWLSSVPFPVDNMNAVLNGLGEELEISFVEGGPSSAELNNELERISPDSFVTHAAAEQRSIEIRIGVVDSKYNPARSNYQRYKRVQALVAEVLVPLAARFPIADVRVK